MYTYVDRQGGESTNLGPHGRSKRGSFVAGEKGDGDEVSLSESRRTEQALHLCAYNTVSPLYLCLSSITRKEPKP